MPAVWVGEAQSTTRRSTCAQDKSTCCQGHSQPSRTPSRPPPKRTPRSLRTRIKGGKSKGKDKDQKPKTQSGDVDSAEDEEGEDDQEEPQDPDAACVNLHRDLVSATSKAKPAVHALKLFCRKCSKQSCKPTLHFASECQASFRCPLDLLTELATSYQSPRSGICWLSSLPDAPILSPAQLTATILRC